jgi:hypothetical protein
MLVFIAPAADAATIVVTEMANDELNSDGDCSLREAVVSVNEDSSRDGCTQGNAADTIRVPAGTYEFEIPPSGADNEGTQGDLDFDQSVTVAGAGVNATIVDGQDLDGVFHPGNAPAVFRDLTIRDGSTTLGGGAVASNSSLTMTRVRMTENFARFTGGAMDSLGPLRLTDAEITNNVSTGDGGGLYLQAPNAGAVLDNVTITGNHADPFPMPATPRDGGGISNVGELLITDSTISENTARHGDGLHNGISGSAELRNVTVSGNGSVIRGGGGNGGGIYNDASGTDLALTHVTLAENTASSTGGSGGNAYNANATANSLTAANTIAATPMTGGNCGGTGIASLGGNLEWVPGGTASPCFADPPDTVGDPLLGPLQDNGGPTPTRALGVNSAGFDAALAGNCLPSDQRGVPRPVNACHSGAYHRALCATILVDEVGTPGADRLVGDDGRDGMLGLGGNDTLIGAGEADGACAGAGNDKLKGGKNRDHLSGRKGRDTLIGGPKFDHHVGGAGNDRLLTRDGGKDVANCGKGKKDVVKPDRIDKRKGCEIVK